MLGILPSHNITAKSAPNDSYLCALSTCNTWIGFSPLPKRPSLRLHATVVKPARESVKVCLPSEDRQEMWRRPACIFTLSSISVSVNTCYVYIYVHMFIYTHTVQICIYTCVYIHLQSTWCVCIHICKIPESFLLALCLLPCLPILSAYLLLYLPI